MQSIKKLPQNRLQPTSSTPLPSNDGAGKPVSRVRLIEGTREFAFISSAVKGVGVLLLQNPISFTITPLEEERGGNTRVNAAHKEPGTWGRFVPPTSVPTPLLAHKGSSGRSPMNAQHNGPTNLANDCASTLKQSVQSRITRRS
ncbi:hypothetical protein CEXT_262511 [Caerostris extrusa]|uniref:Uncharacterized protein n=1 Tax=Caerostris extrusa TaxID=172846 RepID=A0AAV4R137_CAEEX|nr:hypothetical protein CEXT_262511 [Caerostris extrusa]